MKRLKLRLIILYRILFKYKHFVILHVDDKDFTLFALKDHFPDAGGTVDYWGMQEHNAITLIRQTAVNIDETDAILSKAAFDGQVEEIKLKLASKASSQGQ